MSSTSSVGRLTIASIPNFPLESPVRRVKAFPRPVSKSRFPQILSTPYFPAFSSMSLNRQGK
jgi:hypothetical protein